MRACRDCSVRLSATYARYCDNCRWRHRIKRRKYEWTAEKDRYLREKYSSLDRHCGKKIGALWGWPAWVVRHRACQLSLTTPRLDLGFRPWTAEEVQFVEHHAGVRTLTWMARKLRRTLTSVAVKVKRLHLSAKVDHGYPLRSVAMGFGVDDHVVRRWIDRGWLQAEHRGVERQPWGVTDQALVQFISAHRSVYALARVDQVWFLELALGPMAVREMAS